MHIFHSLRSSRRIPAVGWWGNPIRALSQHSEMLRGSEALCLRASVSNEGGERRMRGLGFTDSTTGDWLTLLVLLRLHLATAPAPLSPPSVSTLASPQTNGLLPPTGSSLIWGAEVPQSTPPFSTPLFSPRPLSLTAYDCLSKPTSIPENAVHAPALSVCRGSIPQAGPASLFSASLRRHNQKPGALITLGLS